MAISFLVKIARIVNDPEFGQFPANDNYRPAKRLYLDMF